MVQKILGFFFLLGFVSISFAQPQLSQWHIQGPNQEVILKLEVYLSSTCPHCKDAAVFINTFQKAHPWVQVNQYLINENKSALKQFASRIDSMSVQGFAVPAFVFCDSMWIGFGDKNSAIPLIEGLKYCRDQIQKNSALTDLTIRTLRAQGDVSEFQIPSELSDRPYGKSKETRRSLVTKIIISGRQRHSQVVFTRRMPRYGL